MIVKWSRKHVIALILAVLFAIIITFVGYFTYIVPLEKKIDRANDMLTMQEKLIESNKQEVSAYDESAVTTALQKKIPIKKTTDQVIFLLNDIATRTNSTITQVAVAGNTVEDPDSVNEETPLLEGLKTIQYDLQVTTEGYESMHEFLEGLNEADRLLSLEKLEFDGGTDQNIHFSVTASAYYSPTLTELLIEAPSYNYEPSAKKTTPFSE